MLKLSACFWYCHHSRVVASIQLVKYQYQYLKSIYRVSTQNRKGWSQQCTAVNVRMNHNKTNVQNSHTVTRHCIIEWLLHLRKNQFGEQCVWQSSLTVSPWLNTRCTRALEALKLAHVHVCLSALAAGCSSFRRVWRCECANAAVAVDSSLMTASLSASWSRFIMYDEGDRTQPIRWSNWSLIYH